MAAIFVFLIAGSIVLGALSLVIAGMAIIRGWCLTHLWRWFIVPLFPGMPTLSIYSAIGLALVIGFLFPTNPTKATKSKTEDEQTESDKKKDVKENKEIIFANISGPFLSLLIGWIIHTFFG